MSSSDSAHRRARNIIEFVCHQVGATESVHRAEQDEIGLSLNRFQQQGQTTVDTTQESDGRDGTNAGLVEETSETVGATNIQGQEHATLGDGCDNVLEGLEGILHESFGASHQGGDDFQWTVKRKRNL